MMKNTWKKAVCGSLTAVMLLGSATMAHAAHPFADVSGDSWYASYVDYAYNNKLMAGVSDTAFAPNQKMTRGMLVTVLHSIAQKPGHGGSNPFSDVGDSWYTNAVLWCYEHGIVAGTSATTFTPNSPVTREQMVAIMFKFAAANKLDTSSRADLSGYSDYSRIESYAKDAFAWAVAEGYVSGTSDTSLSPKGVATRAQCATILQHLHEALNAKPVEPQPTEPAPTVPQPTQPTHDFTPEELERPVTEADIPRLEAYARSYAEHVGFIVDTSLNLDNSGYYPAWAMNHTSLEKSIAYAEEGIEGTKESLIAAHGTIQGCGYNSYMEMTSEGLVMYHFYG